MNTTICKYNTVSNSYSKIKHRFKKDTFKVGAAVSGYYFITQGATLGLSSLLGSTASFVYVNMLSNHVDNIEKGSNSNHMLVPICMTLSEVLWNRHHPDIQLDFITTYIGFFAYKLALFRIMYDAIRCDIMDMIEK